MVPKGIKYGWYGGTLGGYLFLPCVAVVFATTDYRWLAGLCMAIFLGGIGYSFRVTPWKYPNTGYGKLMLPLVLPLILFCLIIMVVKPSHLGQTVNGWQFLFLIPLFIMPVVLNWNRTYNTMVKPGQ